MLAVRVRETGGPDVMRLEELETPDPGSGEARVRLEASGVNFLDIRQRTGDFKSVLPITLGNEGAGVVEAMGDGAQARSRSALGWHGGCSRAQTRRTPWFPWMLWCRFPTTSTRGSARR